MDKLPAFIQSGPHNRPVFIADLNSDSRAEIVPIGCEYAMGGGLGRDWTITGVYEARNSQLVPLRTANIEAYERAVKQAYAPHRPEENWSPVKPNEWPDQMSGIDGSAGMYLTALLPADQSCRGIRNPPIENGRLVTSFLTSADPLHNRLPGISM